jgi:hypothetical protein
MRMSVTDDSDISGVLLLILRVLFPKIEWSFFDLVDGIVSEVFSIILRDVAFKY